MVMIMAIAMDMAMAEVMPTAMVIAIFMDGVRFKPLIKQPLHLNQR